MSQQNEELKILHQDETGAIYQSGKTRIEIVAPQISEEERQRRWQNIQRVAWAVWDEMQFKANS